MHAEAKHKAELKQYLKYLIIKAGPMQLIISVVDSVWVVEKENEFIGFVNMTYLELTQLLENSPSQLDFIDIAVLKNEHYALLR